MQSDIPGQEHHSMTIAVSAATGQLGRLVIADLVARGLAADTLALARTPSKGADLGVAVRAFDYGQPDTLAPALAGVDTLLLISSSEIGQRAAQHANVIAAARAAGVVRVVYTSILAADRSSVSLAEEHRATEAALRASGLEVTVLRNGWYSENYAGSIAGALATGAVAGAAGDGRVSSAARADFAAAAAAVLTGQGHAGQTYELAGDTAFTLAELADEIGRQTGRSIAYADMTADAFAALLVQIGVPAGFAPVIAGWDRAIAEGDLFDDSRTLSRLIGRPTTPIADTVRAVISAGAAAA
jgi:NAD(P)H dehydrogenase (quinone)